MAELSMETQAIIDKLKSEGELVRNRGSNSIRSVKIQLDRFEGVFNTISTNITEQTNILRMQADIAQEQLEEQRNRTQLEEIEPPERTEDPTPPRSDTESQQSREETDEKINKMGDAIANALSLKNIATAGIGLFLGYNFLKGFVDEATGGGWSEMEKNVGEFGRSLPEVMGDLRNLSTELPTQLSETSTAIRDSMANMETNIANMSTSIQTLTTNLEGTLETFSTLGGAIAALVGAISIWNLAGLAREMARFINNRFPRRNAPPTTVNPRTNTPAVDANGKPLSNVPGRDPTTGRFTQSPAGAAAQAADAAAASSGGGRGSIVEAPGERAAAASRSGQAFRNLTDVENTISNPTMRKVFVKLLKGLGVLGIAFTIHQAVQLAAILNAPEEGPGSVSKTEKISAVGNFIGELVGGVSLSVGLGILGTTFGPWGTLIGALVGGIAGSFAGGLIGEYIARWAFDDSPTEEDITTMRRLQGIETYYDQVEARPTMLGRTGTAARRRWDSLYGQTHNADGTPKNISQANPASTNPQRSIENSQGGSAIEDVTPMSVDPQSSTLESIQRSNNLSLASQSELLGSAGITTGDTSVVYSPVINAPASYNIGGDNVAVASFNDRRSGGGGRLQYGITGAVS